MKKKFGIIVLFTSIFSAYAQVGINTDTPRQTLDIEGTFGFSQPGFPKDVAGYDKASPLYWNVEGENGDNTSKEKIVTFSENRKRYSPFKKVRYRLELTSKEEDNIDAKLNIKGSDFTIFLLNYRLALKTTAEDVAVNSDIAYIPVLAVQDNGLEAWVAGGELRNVREAYFTAENTSKGYITHGYKTTNSDEWLLGAMFTAPVKARVYKKGDEWYFNADYPYAKPRAFLWDSRTTENHRIIAKDGNSIKKDATYVWEVELLVIDNKYAKDLGTVTLIEKKSGNTSVLSDYKKINTRPGFERFNIDHEKDNQKELEKIKIISPNP